MCHPSNGTDIIIEAYVVCIIIIYYVRSFVYYYSVLYGVCVYVYILLYTSARSSQRIKRKLNLYFSFILLHEIVLIGMLTGKKKNNINKYKQIKITYNIIVLPLPTLEVRIKRTCNIILERGKIIN